MLRWFTAAPKPLKIQVFGVTQPQGSYSPSILGDTTRPGHVTCVLVWSKSDRRRLRKTLHKQTNRHYENNGHLAVNQYYYFVYQLFFQVNPDPLVPPQVVLFTSSGREHLGIRGTDIFTGQMSFLPPSHQCRSTKGNTKHSPNPNQWHPFSSSTTGVLIEGSLLHLCHFSDSNTTP